jgi:peroxiredoxin Q/BCP
MLRHLNFSSRWLLAAVLAVGTLGAESPPVGADAPDFTLRSLAGGNVTLSSVVDEGPVALVVLRGYPGYQCPVCSRQVHDFITNADAFAEAGARVLFVYPGPSDDLQSRAQEFVEDKTFPDHFSMLLDPDFTVTNLYGVRWNEGSQTAYPSTFLVDETGTVTFQKVSDGVRGRTSGAEMAEMLQ